VRFHGERYPLVKNSNEANRAQNRRVTLTLSREPVVTPEPAPAAAPAAPAPEAAPAASEPAPAAAPAAKS